MATVKHIKIYNANYDAAVDYLTLQHNEFTGKPILVEQGRKLPRDYYLIDGINCESYSFNEECNAVNAKFHKNNTYKEIKAHHYIVSFDPRDKDENGLTPEHAQELGMELAQKAFPGHQIIVCTHRDGHNGAGNIHCHIVINSVRKTNVFNAEFEERPCDSLAGNKHHASKAFMDFFKQSTMEICQRENLYQVDLLSPAKVRITDREYWAQRRGQKKLDQENEERIKQGKEPIKSKYETTKSVLRKRILSVLSDNRSLDEFKDKLLEQYGIALEESRGRFSYHLPDRERPIRARQLGTSFEKEAILKAISANEKALVKRTSSIALIVDLKACIKAQENQYYARKVKVSNLQQMAKTLVFCKKTI